MIILHFISLFPQIYMNLSVAARVQEETKVETNLQNHQIQNHETVDRQIQANPLRKCKVFTKKKPNRYKDPW